MVKEQKKEVIVNNDAYKERFQFLLWINDNIICQRYFKVNGYNSDSLVSEELFHTLEDCVLMIQDDLKSKSILYQSIMSAPTKLNGFVNHIDSFNDACTICSTSIEGQVQLENGDIIEKEYHRCNEEDFDDAYSDNEQLEPYEITFKFVFKVDDKIVYERIWDGTAYPKQVRNSVDLSNSDAPKDVSNFSLYSLETVIRYLKYGRVDLLYHIIKKICETMSGGFNDPDAYTKSVSYGVDDNGNEVTYQLSTYNKAFVYGYQKWMKEKTAKYMAELSRAEKYAEYGGLTPGEWNYIERYL